MLKKLFPTLLRTNSLFTSSINHYSKLPHSVNMSGSTVTLNIQAKPNSRETKIITANDNYIKIGLKAIPEAGEANQQLVNFIAQTLDVHPTQIVLKKGTTSKQKIIQINQYHHTQQQLATILEKHLKQ